jgi:circadian clock protein KaiB
MTDSVDCAPLPFYSLVLVVMGNSLLSRQAKENLRRICDEHLKTQVSLEIIDLKEHPELGRKYQVVAIPTLIKLAPPPVRRIIGNLSDKEKVLYGLELGSVRDG